MNPDIKSIALIRHGRSEANDDPSVYLTTPDHAICLARPDDDPAALAAGDLLATLGLDPTDLCSWRSPYVRCVQTEAIAMRRALGGGYDQVLRRDSFLLREQEFGDWDGLSEGEMELRSPERFKRRARMTDHHGRFYFRYPAGESRADVVQRISIFLGKLTVSPYMSYFHGLNVDGGAIVPGLNLAYAF